MTETVTATDDTTETEFGSGIVDAGVDSSTTGPSARVGDARLVEHILSSLLAADPGMVFDQFPLDPVNPSRQGGPAKTRLDALTRFTVHVLTPALASEVHAPLVAELVCRLLEHLTVSEMVDGLDRRAWTETLTAWHDQAAHTSKDRSSSGFVELLFRAYTLTATPESGAWFGPEFDTYITHRDT